MLLYQSHDLTIDSVIYELVSCKMFYQATPNGMYNVQIHDKHSGTYCVCQLACCDYCDSENAPLNINVESGSPDFRPTKTPAEAASHVRKPAPAISNRDINTDKPQPCSRISRDCISRTRARSLSGHRRNRWAIPVIVALEISHESFLMLLQV